MLAAAAGPALADDSPTEPVRPPSADAPVPLWEAGVFAVGAYQPAYPGSDQHLARLLPLPYAIYRGSLLRVEGSGVGLRGPRTPRFEWDASGSAAFGTRGTHVRARDGMPSIGTLVEIGPALRINLGDLLDPARDSRATRLELPVRAVFDANDGLSHQGWTLEPRLSHTAWRDASMALVVSASALFGDRRLNGLYYDVDPLQATAARPAYAAHAGLVATRLSASLRQALSPTLRLSWFAQAETVRGAANESSPLVRSRQDLGVGVSLTWKLWQSQRVGVE